MIIAEKSDKDIPFQRTVANVASKVIEAEGEVAIPSTYPQCFTAFDAPSIHTIIIIIIIIIIKPLNSLAMEIWEFVQVQGQRSNNNKQFAWLGRRLGGRG